MTLPVPLIESKCPDRSTRKGGHQLPRTLLSAAVGEPDLEIFTAESFNKGAADSAGASGDEDGACHALPFAGGAAYSGSQS